MAGGTGTAELDFGSGAGSNEASVAVTGIAGITAGAKVEAFFMRDTSPDHSVGDHLYAAALVGLACGSVSAGVGFTIYARSLEKLTGRFTVNYVWAT